MLEPHLAGIIHSPDHATRDEIVDKIIKRTATICEEELLIPMLDEALKENHDAGKQMVFALLKARLVTKIAFEKKKK